MFRTLYLTLLSLLCVNTMSYAQGEEQSRYEAAKGEAWSLVIDEKMSDYDSEEWVFDGLRGELSAESDGLVVTAGPRIRVNDDHVVLWNRRKLHGDLMVEYDYTRLDRCEESNVNIIYLHAQGSGVAPYTEDIMEWNDLRTVPAMSVYFDNMKTYHISYAVSQGPEMEDKRDYVRGRMYNPTAAKGLRGTDLKPEYFDTGLFEVGVKYHITVMLYEDRMYMNVEGDGVERLMYFEVDPQTRLQRGYMGFRMMWGRSAKYANLKVYERSEM